MSIRIPMREAVEARCPKNGLEPAGLACDDHVWIKYGAYVRLAEATMQQYVYERADPRVVCIPKDFDAFTSPQPNAASITYRFFSDCGRGEPLSDVTELEDWINGKLKRARWPDRVSFHGGPVYICHCDLTQFNIKAGEPVALLDWGFSDIYARVFEEFALLHQFNREWAKFAKTLHKQLFGPEPSKPMRAMALAANYIAFGVSNGLIRRAAKT